MKGPVKIKLKEAGVFLATADGRRKIAAPIRFRAIGERLDGTKAIEIEFEDCDGRSHSELFDMSALNPRNLHIIADRLGNKGYLWPNEGMSSTEILRAVVAKIPDRRFLLVGAPGWHEGAIVTPLRQYGGDRKILIDPNTGAHLASYENGSGSLEGWQESVGCVAKNSTRLRLSIAAAFAAPFLRLLGIDSFAINLFGPTSSGKTSLLYGAASVPGLNNDRTGLPKWSDSETGIEQLAIGHRDGLLPLDESGDQGGGMPVHEKAKLLAFLFSRNRAKTLDKSYQKKVNLTVRDFRIIVLSTSESALKDIAEMAGRPRIGGEGVRFIDVPATELGSLGVFDAVNVPSGRNPAEYGRVLADELRRDARVNQGFAMDAFLKKVMKDPDAAVAKVKDHMATFTSKASLADATGPEHRICEKFAVMYGAAALAIDCGILPWGKRSTRAAIEKCMTAAFATLREVGMAAAPIFDREAFTIRLKGQLDRLSLVPVEKGKKCDGEEARRREAADGFRIGRELYVKSTRWKAFSTAEARELVARKILRVENRADGVTTVSKKIAGVQKKLRYHIIDKSALDRLLGEFGQV